MQTRLSRFDRMMMGCTFPIAKTPVDCCCAHAPASEVSVLEVGSQQRMVSSCGGHSRKAIML